MTTHHQLDVWITATPARAIAHTFAILEPVLALPEDERIRLLDSVRAWYTETTVGRAAALVGCGTAVMQRRLRRFDDLTGRRRTRPNDRAELWIALETLRLYGDDKADPGALTSLMGKYVNLTPHGDTVTTQTCNPPASAHLVPDKTRIKLDIVDRTIPIDAPAISGCVTYADARDIVNKLAALQVASGPVTVYVTYRDTGTSHIHTEHVITHDSLGIIRQQLINARCC